MKWPCRLSRSSAPTAGAGCGTQSRFSCAAVLFTQGGELMPVVLMTAEGSAMVGVVPHVTFTRVESVRFVNCAFGPRTNDASPVGGGVRLSRSAGKKPY